MFDDYVDWAYLGMFVFFCVVVLVVMVALSLAMVPLANWVARTQCDALARQNDHLEFDYGWWTGCRVKTPSGNWIDVDNMYLIEGMEVER